MVFLGKNLNMSIVAGIGYCLEVIGKEGQGEYIWSFVTTNYPVLIMIVDLR